MLDLDQATRDTIRRSFVPVLARRDEFADDFYRRLFTLEPSLRTMFPQDVAETRRKFVDTIVVLVDLAAVSGPVGHILEELGARHFAYGVRTEHYAVAIDALLETLRGTGAAFDEAAGRAWGVLLDEVCEGMLSGAERARAIAADTFDADVDEPR